MIEVRIANGCRRLINAESIVQVGELPSGKNSNTVITLTTGEVIFSTDYYEVVKEAIYEGVNA